MSIINLDDESTQHNQRATVTASKGKFFNLRESAFGFILAEIEKKIHIGKNLIKIIEEINRPLHPR